MGFFRKDPVAQVDKALATMRSEMVANETDGRGLYNRPRYMAAQNAIEQLGHDATPTLLAHLERLRDVPEGSPDQSLRWEVVSLLGKTRDPLAVPTLTGLLGSVCPGLAVALSRTDEGTQALIAASRASDAFIRSRAMGVAASSYRPREVIDALVRGLGDPELSVRYDALSQVVGFEKRDPTIMDALRTVKASDANEQMRDRADSWLRRNGAL